jgi:hypothetical protein
MAESYLLIRKYEIAIYFITWMSPETLCFVKEAKQKRLIPGLAK